MAFLKDALALVDDKLASVFSTPAHDPEKARKPLLNGIAKTKTQFSEGKTKAPNKWWSVNNNVVAFAPKLGDDPLMINGKPLLYIPAERFPEFLETLQAAVEAGEFDDELKNHGAGNATVRTPRKAREPGTGGGKGWSDSRREAFARTIQARKEAKAKG